MAASNDKQLKEIIVVGCGVVGLTTALKILEQGGYKVTIIAETFPTDPKTIRYTSHWAGAHHVSHARSDQRQLKMDKETFDVMWKSSAPGGAAESCFLRHTQTEYHGGEIPSPHWLEFMPDFRYLTEAELLPGSTNAFSFSTVTMNTPAYLNWLLSTFLARGGTLARASLQHISQVFESGAKPFTGARSSATVDAVICCVGIGARTLGGVEDKDVYPIRGQSVLLRAPWLNYGRTMTAVDGTYTYVMPRSGGTVLIGGTRVANDWYPQPRPETTSDILARALVLVPEIAPPHTREGGRVPTVDDILPIVIEEGCGLRPARKGGIRLETEWFHKAGGKIAVVYNYGHSGVGFLSSWGSASMALGLLEDALNGNGQPDIIATDIPVAVTGFVPGN